jgi:hypothetical protein
LSRRRASTSLFGIAMIRPPQRQRRLAVSARSNAVRRHVPHTATSPIRRAGPLPRPDEPGLGFIALHRTSPAARAQAGSPGATELDEGRMIMAPRVRLARRSSVDKKAKTPKKPKTAKPKGSTTTR